MYKLLAHHGSLHYYRPVPMGVQPVQRNMAPNLEGPQIQDQQPIRSINILVCVIGSNQLPIALRELVIPLPFFRGSNDVWSSRLARSRDLIGQRHKASMCHLRQPYFIHLIDDELIIFICMHQLIQAVLMRDRKI